MQILVLEDNKKQTQKQKKENDPYTNKYQHYVAFSYSYKLVCVGDKLSKPFKSNLG